MFIDADPITVMRAVSLNQLIGLAGQAVMMAHALGNPFDIAATLTFRKYKLWLVEDNVTLSAAVIQCQEQWRRVLVSSKIVPV